MTNEKETPQDEDWLSSMVSDIVNVQQSLPIHDNPLQNILAAVVATHDRIRNSPNTD
jgi:hypothetical protein